MELFGISLPLAAWIPIILVVGGVVYIAILIAGGYIFDYFGGWDASRIFEDIFGWPLSRLESGWVAVGGVISKLWKIRARHLFYSAFYFEPHKKWNQAEQERVDRQLKALANDFHGTCLAQEEARSKWHQDPSIDLDEFEENVRSIKDRFWDAHKAARLCGFKVERQYTDYLSAAHKQPAWMTS